MSNRSYKCRWIIPLLLLLPGTVCAQTCLEEELRPWFTPYAPATTTQVFWASSQDPPITVLDVVQPVTSRVCSSGGPSNAIGVKLQLSQGASGAVTVRENSCVDLAVPHVSIEPGCISTNLLCTPVTKQWKCKNNIPDGNTRYTPFWSRGWYVVSPHPDQSIMKDAETLVVNYHPNPEKTVPPGYLLVSEDLRLVRVCGHATINIALNNPLSKAPDLKKNINDCQYIQGKSLWILPEEAQQPASYVSYQVIW
jgi:hypothetical protein